MLKSKATPLFLSAILATSLLSLPSEAKEKAAKNQKATATPQASATPAAKASPEGHPADIEPTLGMTQAEVLQRYGKPEYKSSMLGGNETWKYQFDKGKNFIPGGVFMKKRQGSVTFDKKTGKVIEVKWGKRRF